MRKIFLLTAFSIFAVGNICSAQNGAVITTIAGTGSPGYTGDGGSAISAAVGQPYGAAIDNAGNFYFVDNIHNVVRRINTSGIITKVAGSGTGYSGDGGIATVAAMQPTDVAVDASGNLYIADGANYRIRKVNTAGIITTIAGNGSLGNTGDGGPATAAKIGFTYGVAVDVFGNVYLSDYTNNVVRKVNTSGIISTVAGSGTAGYSGDGGPAANIAKLFKPRGIALDASGNMYIADDSNYVVRKVNASGVISTFAGNSNPVFSGDGGPATSAGFVHPGYIAISNSGDIYITDLGDYRVRRVNPIGNIYTMAGDGMNNCNGYGGLAINAGITPVGIAVDNNYNIYIANQGCAFINNIRLQPTVVSDSFSVYFDNLCNGVSITAVANSYTHLNLRISYGDFSSDLGGFTASTPGFEFVNFVHSYANPGTYTIRMVLLDGTNPIDSIVYSYNNLACTTFPVRFYFDTNNDCIKDDSEQYNIFPVMTEVDSNGIAIDTISSTEGFDYTAYGYSTDIYSFHILSAPAGQRVSCPSKWSD